MFKHYIKKKITYYPLNTETMKVEKDKKRVEENSNYIPKSHRPKWCIQHNKKFIPQHKCLFGDDVIVENRCPFFACTEADDVIKIITKEDKNGRL